jgi:hypothetical protein
MHYHEQNLLAGVEVPVVAGNLRGKRFDVVLKDGKKIEQKSWNKWREDSTIAQIADEATRDKVIKMQNNRLTAFETGINARLADPANHLHIEFQHSVPATVSQRLQQLRDTNYNNRLTWEVL